MPEPDYRGDSAFAKSVTFMKWSAKEIHTPAGAKENQMAASTKKSKEIEKQTDNNSEWRS